MATSGVTGHYIGNQIELTSLQQTVAVFHFLIIILASTATIVDTFNTQNSTALDNIHLASIHLANTIGSVIITGSFKIYGKLDEKLESAPLQHPALDQINMGLRSMTLSVGVVVMGVFIKKNSFIIL